jgi:hypothetical protein
MEKHNEEYILQPDKKAPIIRIQEVTNRLQLLLAIQRIQDSKTIFSNQDSRVVVLGKDIMSTL